MKFLKIHVALILTVLVSACSSSKVVLLEKETDTNLYQIYINEDGALLNPQNEKIIDKENEAKYVENILSNYKKQKALKPNLELTIFIHGGLNTYNSATSRVKNLKAEMLADDKYPLFISWNSGPFTNYFDHLFFMRNGEKARVLGPLSSPFILVEDVLRSAARIPASLYRIFVSQNSSLKSYKSKEEERYNQALANLESTAIVVHNSDNDTGFGFKDWFSVVNPTKIVTAPFIDGLGRGAWNSMKRRTDLVLINDKSHEGSKLEDAQTAANLFFVQFYNRYKNTETINLIGHSMGTIVANNILTQYQHIEFDNIVYLAAACSIDDLTKVVHPYLVNNKQTTFYNATLNPYNDIAENVFYDFTPRGSLLMWIDQFLEDTNTFSDKTAGFWFNLIRGAEKAFPEKEVHNRVHFTQFGLKDGSPETHGAFGEYPFWRKEFWKGDFEGGR